MEQNIIEIKNANKYFPGVHAIKDFDIAIHEGEVHAICGENGAGKSAITKVMAGVYTLDEGKIFFQGKPVGYKKVSEAQKIGICRVPQELELINDFTVIQNIGVSNIPLNKYKLIDWNIMRENAKKILAQLNIDIDINKRVGDLTIGHQQMVAIAKALMLNPKVLILDEPTSSLSEKEARILMDTIKLLKSKKITILYISHRLEEIKEIADRITVMRDGSKIATAGIDDVDIPKIIELMIGRDLSEQYPKEKIARGEAVLEVKNMFAEGVKGNSLMLHKGEILGMYGLVGAGRTEMIRAIYGANKVDKGEIVLDGEIIHPDSPKKAIKNGIVLIPEDRRTQGFIADLPVKENMTLGNLKRFCKNALIKTKTETSEVIRYIDMLDIQPPYLNVEVQYLSGGNQQKVVIAKWLCGPFKVIIFDEPTKGIDVGAKTEIYKIMSKLAKEGKGIIFISSDMPEVMGISDRILVFKDNKISADIKREEFSEERILSAVI
ncbi:sugar ABC transporter ATP-binding protein [Petroclostridium sp. X23]|uniref:sugar ABC transporter ATP-binding protein n=1 Tax=Petroclostridium sp. X23 TaxID=3045146 RepID=UPI0024AE758B|nr:sugar ABC transporter ATP-binding protein [Petroclostridium sp. X23]WHH60502.1 sugar ABC transporter ATP-binding protein [Petroclostridium sp. X23]